MSEATVSTYTTSWPVYSLSCAAESPVRLSLGSFMEEPSNKVEVVQLNESSHRFDLIATFDQVFPPTKVLWMPGNRELLATASDCLRLYETSPRPGLKTELPTVRDWKLTAPLTSMDWNRVDSRLVATSCIDTTCTVWDVLSESVVVQFVTHENEVYDIAWAEGVDCFATVSADGSAKRFDLRDPGTGLTLYESVSAYAPLLRVAWNYVNPVYLAVLAMDSGGIMVLDTRGPPTPVYELMGHNSINALAWAPSVGDQVCTVGDDCQALIWTIGGEKPVHRVAYVAAAEIPAVQWTQQDWIAVAVNNTVQTAKVATSA